MLTLYHGPNTRSSRIIRLLIEMEALDKVNVRVVGLVRQGNIGTPDPANPHPEGKVPLLDHDGVLIRESNAIMLYLTDLFDSPLGVSVGDPKRGSYLSWLAYYGNIVEPVVVGQVAGVTHPAYFATFRGPSEMGEHLAATLQDQPFLMGDHFTAADLLMVSVFSFAPQMTPDINVVEDWISRCEARPSFQMMKDRDAAMLEVEPAA